jgi:very-short-patch-repair endonuclease
MIKEFICKNCHKIFIKYDNHPYKFCSFQCSREGQIGVIRKPQKEFTCKLCGKQFFRQVSPNAKYPIKEFCSPVCRNKARALQDIICPVCGTYFKPNKINGAHKPAKKYCGKQCADIGRKGHPSPRKQNSLISEISKLRNTHTAKEIAKITGKSQASITCLVNKYLSKLPISLAKERQGKAAKERMTLNNPMQNPDIARKASLIMKKKFRDDLIFRERNLAAKAKSNKRNGTKPELLCKSILENLAIEFDYQYLIKTKFIVDFKVNNLILQIDGEYWHGHPRFEPLTQRQLSQRKRDIAQDKYLSKCGYIVIRIWESELSESRIKDILSKVV